MHQCCYDFCHGLKIEGHSFCGEHKCPVESCKNTNYCGEHTCDEYDCPRVKLVGSNHCVKHFTFNDLVNIAQKERSYVPNDIWKLIIKYE
jgi:hypothetical protein